MIVLDLSILNQKGTPMFNSDTFANRPAFGIVGRIFISTDTKEFYRDTGTSWELIGGPGSGTITGSGAATQVAFWNGASSISGSNNLWWDSTNNYLGISTNTPTTALDVHHSTTSGAIFNQTTATNNNTINFQTSGSGRWRIGNFYTAGADDFGIFDVVGTLQQFTIVKTSGQTFIGAKTTASGRLVVNSATADNHLQIVGANSPSIRIDNAGSGGTQRFVFGLATASNNYILGSIAGQFCITTHSIGDILFGMWQGVQATEAMRLSTASNLIVGSSTDNGNRLQIQGSGSFSNSVISSSSAFGNIGGFYLNFGGSGFSRSWRIINDTNSFGDFDIQQSTTQTGSTYSTRLYISPTGNLGLGVVPSAWGGSYNDGAFQMKLGAALVNNNANDVHLVNNCYFNGTNWIYQSTNSSSRYEQFNGGHFWLNASSGTLGNAITFTQAMTLSQIGNLGIGNIIPGSDGGVVPRLAVSNPSNADKFVGIGYDNTGDYGFIHCIHRATSWKSLAIQAFGGNLLIGTTIDIGTKVHVNGTTYTAGLSVNASAFQNDVTLSTGTTYVYDAPSGSHTFTLQNSSGKNQIFIVKNATARNLTIAAQTGQNIIDNAGVASSTFTLSANKVMIIQQDGGNKNYILSIY
jgi:hypothetical protein